MLALCWWCCVCVCCLWLTTHQFMAGPPSPMRRVINNWPFVPFLPRLFLFSAPLLLLFLSPRPPIPSSSSFFPHPYSLLTYHLPLLSIIHSFFLCCPFHSQFLYLFSQTSTFPFVHCSATIPKPTFLSLDFSSSQVKVETICPTFIKLLHFLPSHST